VSEYQSGGQGGWPAQPPANSEYGQGRGYRYGYGPVPQDSHGAPQAAPPRRRRRRRWPVVLLVLVILLLAAAGIGDQVARSYAQNRIAQQIQSSANLSARPSVSIEGWPFLTQIAAHDVKAVDISANGVTADSGKLPFSFTAKAIGVHLNASFNSATIDRINGRATLPFSSVASLLGLPGGTVAISADPAAGPDAVKASSGLGSVTGTVELATPNQIDVRLNSATGLASLLGGLSGNAIKIQIPRLPVGLVVRSVSVNSQGIVALASASNTTLSQ
jgi:hypothetical protein